MKQEEQNTKIDKYIDFIKLITSMPLEIEVEKKDVTEVRVQRDIEYIYFNEEMAVKDAILYFTLNDELKKVEIFKDKLLRIKKDMEDFVKNYDSFGIILNDNTTLEPKDVSKVLNLNINSLNNVISYIDKQTSPPQQPETTKPDDTIKELHNHIFKGNAFEVFEKYHYNKSLAENNRTDLNLLYQLFHRDNLFVETVELKHYIQWLNITYEYSLVELKKVDINSKPNIQRTNDYKEYKRTTLKQP